MYSKSLQLLDTEIYAFLIIHSKTGEVLDGNPLAKKLFHVNERFPKAEELFSHTLEEEALNQLKENVKTQDSVCFYDILATPENANTFYCNVEVCYADRGKHILFLVLREKSTEKELQMKDMIELTDNPIFILENDHCLTVAYGNSRYYHCIHKKKEEIEGKSYSFLDLLPMAHREVFLNTVEQQLVAHGVCDVDFEITFDSEFYQLFRLNAYRSTLDDRIYGVLMSVRRQSELMKKIEYDQQYFDIMQRFSKDLLFRIDVKKQTLVHRGDISKFVGLLPEVENFPECMRENRLVHPEDLDAYIAFAYRLMNGTEASFEPRFQFNTGVFEKYRLQGSPLFDTEGNTVQVVGKCENIQKFVDIEAKANYDSLTTTLNKQSFRELVEDSMKRAVESDKFALLFLDLDDFKGVNDNLGHVFGDFLLEAMAKRIMNCIRSQDRVGRVGGDEFVIFFQFAPSHESALERAGAILYSLRRDFTYGKQSYKAKASIGIAMFPEHGDTYEMLYDKADKALYKSKALGKDVATIYSADLETEKPQ